MTREERVLSFVNRLRKRFDAEALDELPKGIPCAGEYCPIAAAMPMCAEVDEFETWLWDGTYNGYQDPIVVKNPKYVGAFVRAFDDGKLPHLVATASGRE